MKANELRIGNWIRDVHSPRGAWEVKQLTTKVCYYGDYRSFYRNLEPIPLTEEWLIKFGATTLETPHGNQYSIGNRLFVIREGKIVDYGSSVTLEFVHRFQNFMFELTNEELTITQ